MHTSQQLKTWRWYVKDSITRAQMNRIYGNIPLEEIPWNIETPPRALVELIKCGKVKPCKSIDLGCGAGNYAIYLAGQGLDVTGVDISPIAINIAREHSREKSITCNFLVADVLGNISIAIKETFDFAYDWELLHHIFPGKRKKYIDNVHALLHPGGKYLSVCFNEKDTQFGGSGKYRTTKLGTTLYFSTLDELRDLFDPYFNILDLRTIEISGKFVRHLTNYAFMEKRRKPSKGNIHEE